jgi:hypothetical protein
MHTSMGGCLSIGHTAIRIAASLCQWIFFLLKLIEKKKKKKDSGGTL